MKKLTTSSLIIFSILVISVLTAGLVFYQNKKDNQVANSKSGALIEETIKQLNSSGKSLVLNMEEIGKHNKQSDCWIVINNKVYNITSYFGSHPGGNSTMSATCGKDATNAYMTKDPYAKDSTSGQSHSSRARSMLADYYLGDLNQTIGNQNTSATNQNTLPKSNLTTTNSQTNNTPSSQQNISPVIPVSGSITLSMSEIAKHNKQSDCWYLINGKVYNITSYFGSHPGGSSVMASSCGKDATDAYMTKDPNATSSGSRSAHSSGAINLLANYYIGDLNQTIGSQKITDTNNIVSSNTGESEDEYENEYEDD